MCLFNIKYWRNS